MSYDVGVLSPKFGAEVTGLKLSHVLSENDINELYELIHKYQLLIFRNQSMTPEEQVSVCSRFGPIELHPAKEVPWVHRELTYVANTDLTLTQVFEHSGPPFELWHSDTCYLPEPARISLLYAERVPSSNGETLFADMNQAYKDLPLDIKHQLENKQAVYGSGQRLMERCQKRGYNIHISESEREPDVVHPVIRTHPYTKQKSIYVNWAHTDSILGLSDNESREMLDYLFQHARLEKYVFSYHPRQGDLMVWDNASLVHSNTDKKLSDIRIMRRVMIKGSKPF